MFETLCERARGAIASVFNEQSVSSAETIEALEELAGGIEDMISAIKEDGSLIAEEEGE